MYKPTQTTNRVRSLRNKFESYERNKIECTKNNEVSNITKCHKADNRYEKPQLHRQISDPLKINIKRTPAFRIDKNIAENSNFHRNCFKGSTLFEDKLKQYSAIKNNCDIVNNCEHDSVLGDTNDNTRSSNHTLVKCEATNDAEPMVEIFDNLKEHVHSDNSQKNKCENENLPDNNESALYTVPIPKALRSKQLENSVVNNECDMYSNLKLKNDIIFSDLKLTDTLKTALKKPLPPGPAPRKPPRTFQHVQINCDIKKNNSFLHVNSYSERVPIKPKSPGKKTDPKYMLNKLENALRNNKVLCKKQYKSEISTSGEDSDDSFLSFSSKCNKVQQKPTVSGNSSDVSTFNCLGTMNCYRSDCEKGNQPSSSFFINDPEEPIYVEPYHYLKD